MSYHTAPQVKPLQNHTHTQARTHYFTDGRHRLESRPRHQLLWIVRGQTDQRADRFQFLPAHYEGVSKTFRTGRLERELQMVQISATSCSCIAILWVSLVSFAAITLCYASQRVIPKVSGLVAWNENYKWYSSVQLGAVVLLFCGSV
jgi:hypothetical protein